MGLLKWVVILLVPVALAVIISSVYFCSPPVKPELKDGWWGYGEKGSKPASATVDPFEVKVSSDVLADLKARVLKTRYIESFPQTNFEYGFNSAYLKDVVRYWVEKYNWRDHEKILNSYPQFTTTIEGIQVHFVHVKPAKNADKARPLLMVHGWPGSFWEFYKIIPLLVGTDKVVSDIPFELIIPSIPGYGFSEAPHQPGFDASDAARIFDILMRRLGHQRYYVQGGDWGAIIVKIMGQIYDSNIIGVHTNMAVPPFDSCGVFVRLLIGTVFPSLIYTPAEMKTLPSLSQQFITLIRETGYMHIQATKPDTVATGLNDSPVGLAAYILEKFSTWSNPENRFCKDGCITKHFTLDDVLTNVMIYWVTESIAPSQRFYKENLANKKLEQIGRLPLKVPTGVAWFPHELVPTPESLVRTHMENVVQFTVMPDGGHFAAMEKPQLVADDVISFVKIVEGAAKEDAANA